MALEGFQVEYNIGNIAKPQMLNGIDDGETGNSVDTKVPSMYRTN